MECVKSGKGKRGTCVCKSGYEVCGSDGVTYGNVCEMRAASRRAVDGEQSEIKVLKKGKCERAPVIVTPPKEIWNVTGAQVFLSCEAIGVPTPVLVWKKVKQILTTSKGVENLELLPGDRDNLAIQTRGGPEKHEVTGWVLISPLSKLDAGDYECHATNSKGQVSAVGSIHVVDSTEDIPSKKGNAHPGDRTQASVSLIPLRSQSCSHMLQECPGVSFGTISITFHVKDVARILVHLMWAMFGSYASVIR
ncbi:IBP7 protein, partial [Amia calva]|nr:IBP7 protein [Amia calva]